MKTKTLRYFILSFLVLTSSAAFGEFLPSYILKMEPRFTHHILIVEKSRHKLYVFENNDTKPKLVKSYQIATGKKRGNKFLQGDHRTPEGVYQTQDFLSKKDLLQRYQDQAKIYGSGAFTLNYPNFFDRLRGKTGGGIWIHSTDDESRIEKGLDSRGCVVVNDENLKDLSQFVDLENTPVVIVENFEYLSDETWSKTRTELETFVDSWITSWKNENIDSYIQHYDKNLFQSNSRKYNAFKTYKKNVFAVDGRPFIDIKNSSIIVFGETAVVTLEQHYRSKTLPYEIGKKTLHLKKDRYYNWKIVSESWSKLNDANNDVAFKPSINRYFGESI